MAAGGTQRLLLLPLVLLVLLVLVASPSPGDAAATPTSLNGLATWATTGSRLAFVAAAVGSRRGYLWVESFGSGRPRPLRDDPPVGLGQIDQLAPGPNGTWGCLERTVGNTERYYGVDVVSSRGGGTQVATAGGPTGANGDPPVSSIPLLVGDGDFLGYLYVTPAGVVQLFQITRSGHGKRIATLVGVTAPQEAVLGSGNLAIREADGDVAVYTTTGRQLASIPAGAASVALTANRVVVRTHGRRLRVYGLRGGLVHDWALAASAFTTGLAAYGRYAVYLGANKALHAVRLSNGHDVVVARAGAGWFWDGASLEAPGVVVPLTSQHGKSFSTALRTVPTTTLERALGG